MHNSEQDTNASAKKKQTTIVVQSHLYNKANLQGKHLNNQDLPLFGVGNYRRGVANNASRGADCTWTAALNSARRGSDVPVARPMASLLSEFAEGLSHAGTWGEQQLAPAGTPWWIWNGSTEARSGLLDFLSEGHLANNDGLNAYLMLRSFWRAKPLRLLLRCMSEMVRPNTGIIFNSFRFAL